MPIEPSVKYPYGMEKIKNFVVLVPALLFIYCGGTILNTSIIDLYYAKPIEAEIMGLSSVGAYIISLGIETGIIFKNLSDS